jgi:RNA polymerase sigma-70 factor, ECF subfamily
MQLEENTQPAGLERYREYLLLLARVQLGDPTSPSEQAVRNEQLANLAEAILQLPEPQRTALMLRYTQGASVAEISRQLGRAPTAVAELLKRGTHHLRLLLQEPG